MRQRNPPTITFHRQSPGTTAISRLVLAFVAGLALLMPVNYRAGTDRAHPHATFQLWIDAATGRSHHHRGEGDHQHRETTVPIAHDPGVVADSGHDPVHGKIDHETLATHGTYVLRKSAVAVILGDVPTSQQPDTAETFNTLMPMQFANALGALGMLIAFLCLGDTRRPCWADGRRLTGIPHLPESPPPRPASC